jgi:Sel1 repeat
MAVTLISLGIVCILSAIVGGGLKALGTEIPVVASPRRQLMLFAAGVVLVSSSYYFGPRIDSGKELADGLRLYDLGRQTEAFEHLETAAKARNIEAQYHYGQMLYDGEGCKPNKEQGMRWIRKAAEGGFAPAQAVLAYSYYSGTNGIEKDLRLAKEWAEKSAGQNDPMGLEIDGVIEEDASTQIDLLRRSAKLGYAPAQFALSRLLLESQLKKRKAAPDDVSNTLHWLTQAALQGDADAQELLAEIDFMASSKAPTAAGARANLEDAYRWLELALQNQTGRFPLDKVPRDEGEKLKIKIEGVLPPDAQMRVVNSILTWQPELALPYRHGAE